jgi:hypothetical protein
MVALPARQCVCGVLVQALTCVIMCSVCWAPAYRIGKSSTVITTVLLLLSMYDFAVTLTRH